MVKGTKVGTSTDIDGKFTIGKLPAGAKTLVVSYIGMKTKQVPIVKGTEMKISLESDAEQLREVVVTGMQKMDKRLFTGAATKIDARMHASAVWPTSAEASKAALQVSLSERIRYFRYRPQDPRPRCHIYLR